MFRNIMLVCAVSSFIALAGLVDVADKTGVTIKARCFLSLMRPQTLASASAFATTTAVRIATSGLSEIESIPS